MLSAVIKHVAPYLMCCKGKTLVKLSDLSFPWKHSWFVCSWHGVYTEAYNRARYSHINTRAASKLP